MGTARSLLSPRGWGGGAALVLAVGLTLSPRASAHALLAGSTPPSGSLVSTPPRAVTLTFTETPEPALSTVQVLDSEGRRVDLRGPQPVPGRSRTLEVPLRPLGRGVYTVTWRTVSQVDGHVTGGAFAFGVGVAAPAPLGPQPASAPWPSLADVASRWAIYMGLGGLLGGALVAVLLADLVPAPRGFLWAAWALATAGVLGLALAQAGAAGAEFGRFLGTPLGRAIGWRLLPLLLAAGGLIYDSRRRAGPWWSSWSVVGAGAMGMAFAHVLAGHAGAGSGPWRWPNILDQWAHAVAVGLWLGGLAVLLVKARDLSGTRRRDVVRRFSGAAGILLAVVVATGILRAVDEVRSPGALLATDFGRVVLLKASLLLVLAGLGAVNRYWSLPMVHLSLHRVRRVGAAELLVGALALGATALLTGFPPPSALPTPANSGPLVVEGSDYATSVRVRLEVSPGVVGANRFVVRAVDYDTGRPVEARQVTLRFARPDRPGLGTSSLRLRRTGSGTYEGEGANLSMEGAWTVTAVIQEDSGAPTVPLTVVARPLSGVVRTIAAPGQPTLYSVTLPGGRVLDVYLDPQRPGFNEVHATFIDASGGELPVPELATITVARPGGSPQRIPVRRFGPGHFIGDADLPAGRWEVAIRATARDGTPLGAHLVVTLP